MLVCCVHLTGPTMLRSYQRTWLLARECEQSASCTRRTRERPSVSRYVCLCVDEEHPRYKYTATHTHETRTALAQICGEWALDFGRPAENARPAACDRLGTRGKLWSGWAVVLACRVRTCVGLCERACVVPWPWWLNVRRCGVCYWSARIVIACACISVLCGVRHTHRVIRGRCRVIDGIGTFFSTMFFVH